MEPTSYNSIFSRPDDGYKPSFLRDTARLHLFNNYVSESKDTINERDDAYAGFYSSFYQEQIEDKYKQLGRPDLYLSTRTTVLEGAEFEIRNNLLGDTGSITNRVFGAFKVSNLFSNEDEDREFSKQLVQDFSEFIVKPKSEREITGINLLPDIQQLQKIDYTIDQFINKGISDAVPNSSQIRQDIEEFQQRTYNSASNINIVTGGGLRQTKKLLDNISYLSRPGILPAIGIMHDATNEVSIDIFQYQNESVIDYHITNLLERARDFSEGVKAGQDPERFTFNLRIATNKEAAHDDTGYNILGPNFIAIRKLERLKELYGEGGSIGHYLNINVSMVDRRSHPKFLVSDNTAIVGSQNLTNPVGKSLYQQGSNFETVRVLHFNNDQYTPEGLQEAMEQKLIARGNIDSDTLQYMQARAVMNRINKSPQDKFLSTSQRNLGGPMETMDLLTKTIAYANSKQGRSGNVKISTILDQVFLLQHEKELFTGVTKGEMGEEDTHTFSTNESFIKRKSDNYRKKVQSPFIDMIIEGRATAVVDVRNYYEKIQKPIFDRLSSSGLLAKYDYDLNLLVDKLGANTGTAAQRRKALMSEMKAFNFDESMASQILVMTSGNVLTSNVPRQHVKSFLATEEEKVLAYTDGSSNFGVFSTGYDNSTADNKLTNFEMNLIYADNKIRNYGNNPLGKNYLKDFESTFSLSKTQETEELQRAASHHNEMFRNISSQRVGQLQYTNVDNRAEWEKSVDRTRLIELYNNLTELSAKTGNPDLIKIGLEYDARGPIALTTKIGNQLTYKFTALTSASGENPGFIYNINKSKQIGESDFTNATSKPVALGIERGGNKLIVNTGERVTLTPIETTMGLISSVALETEQIRLIRAPLTEYQNRYGGGLEANEDFISGTARYLLHLSGNKGVNIDNILNPAEVLSNHIVKGALERLQIKMSNPDQNARNIHNLTGTKFDSDHRKANIDRLTKLIEIFGVSNTTDRVSLLTGQGLERMNSLTGFMSHLLNSPEYADILYDFIEAQKDTLYKKSVSKAINDISNRAYDPYLLRTQVNNYSSTQAGRQKPLYGIGRGRDQFGEVMTSASRDNAEGIMRLAAFAFPSSPFEFNGTNNLGRGKDIIYTGVADSGGSREKTEYDNYYGNYTNLLPYYSHTKIGTTTSFGLLSDTGVGFNIRLSDQEEYRESIRKVVGDKLAESIYQQTINTIKGSRGDRENLLLFNFDTSKKASQIFQRLKNVKGSRPLNEVSLSLQNLLDSDRANPMSIYENRFSNGTRIVRNYNELQSSYLEDLRAGVKALGGGKEHLINEDYSIGAVYGNKIKTTLSTELAVELEAIRREIEETFGTITASGIGAELLRVHLLAIDTQASMTRGFTGSSKRGGHSVMLLQLSGAYSDYSYTNPFYGGEKGLKVGFSDRTVKGQQASKLADTTLLDGSNGWDTQENILVQSGDFNAYDPATRKTYTYRYNPTTGQNEKIRVVDSRKEYQVANNLIDKVGYAPSISDLRATSNAASFTGENPVELLNDVRLLEGNIHSNEIQVEINYQRLSDQTTRRLESQSGGLLKLNPINVYGKFFNNLLDHFNKNVGGSFANTQVGIHQLRGIANPSNFKSYMYEHGATILTDRQLTNNLLGNDARKLAASLIMSFGVDNTTLGNEVLSTLSELAGSKVLGEYFQDLHTTTLITSSVAAMESGKTVTNLDIAKEFIKGTKVASNRDKEFSKLQIRTLEMIGLDEILSVLKGGDATKFIDALRLLLSDPGGSVLKGEYLDIGKDRGRELALLAGSIDLFSQMANTSATDIKTFNAAIDKSAFYSLGTIGGLTVEELEKRKEELANLINSFGNKSYIVGGYISASSSSSKVALSSKKQSFIEQQHLAWTPFYNNLEKFQRGGTVDQVRSFLSTIFGAMTGTYSGEYIHATKDLQEVDIVSPFARSAIFKSHAIGTSYSPLVNDPTFSKLQNGYEVMGLIHSLIGEDTFSLHSENITFIKSILNTYSKKVKGWENSGIETAIERIDKYLNSKKNIDIYTLRELVEVGYSKAISSFDEMYNTFRLHEDKGPGINPNESKSSGMQRSAGKMGRMVLSIPSLEFNGDGTVKYDKSSGARQKGWSLAGEDLKMLGESYGGFEPELVKTQVIIWEALHPNNRISKFFDMVAVNGSDRGQIQVDSVTLKELIQFNEAFNLFPYMLAQEASAAQQKLFGNKLGFDGGTTTPAAMWLGSNRAEVMPEILIERWGGNSSVSAKGILLKTLNQELQAGVEEMTALNREKDAIDKARAAKSAEFDFIHEGYEQHKNALHDDIRVIKSHKDELIEEKVYLKAYNSILKANKETIKEGLNTTLNIKKSLNKSISYYSSKVDEIEQKIKPLYQEVDEQKQRITTLTEQVQTYTERRNSLLEHRDYIQRSLVYNTALSQSQITNYLVDSNKLSNEIDFLINQLEETNSKLRIANTELTHKESRLLIAANRYNPQIDKFNSRIEKLKAQIQNIENQIVERDYHGRIHQYNNYMGEVSFDIDAINNELSKIPGPLRLNNIGIKQAKQDQNFINRYERYEANQEYDTRSSINKNQYTIASNKQKLLSAFANMLKDGISLIASQQLANIQEQSSSYQKTLSSIRSNFAGELNTLRDINSKIESIGAEKSKLSRELDRPELRHIIKRRIVNLELQEKRLISQRQSILDNTGILKLINQIEGRNNTSNTFSVSNFDTETKNRAKDGTDHYVQVLGLYETQAIRNELVGIAFNESYKYKGQVVSNYNRANESLKNTPSIIEGLVIGSALSNRTYINPNELDEEMSKGGGDYLKALGFQSRDIKATKQFLQLSIEEVHTFASGLLNKLKQEHNIGLTQGVEDRFNLLFSSLNNLSHMVETGSPTRLKDIKELIELEVYRFHTELGLGKVQTNRSSPMGGPYLGSDVNSVFSLKEVDNYYKDIGLDIQLSPDNDSEGANKTLHLRNVIGWHQSQGGDYDGDMVINILSKRDNLRLKIPGIQSKIAEVERQNAILLPRAEKALLEGKTKTHEALSKVIAENTGRITNWQKGIVSINDTILRMDNHESIDTFKVEAAKFIGKYTKVDYRFFLGQKHGGWSQEEVDPSILFTYMEQGRGLFGGMENIFTAEGNASNKNLFDTFTQLAQHEDKLTSANWLDGFQAQNDAQSQIHQILSNDSNLSKEVRSGLIKHITEQRNQGFESGEAVSRGVADYLARIYTAKTGTEQLHKFNAKGIHGAAMTQETFENMGKTLSQAGSVILGKTYNTMVGMLYTESPSLAISYAVLNDPSEHMKSFIDQAYGDKAHEVWTQMSSDALAVRTKAEGMGAFLQVTQQILRDAIKPKSGEQFLKDIDEAIDRYHSSKGGTELEREAARENLVKAFGPGSGLKSLIQLESLTSDLQGLMSKDKSDQGLFQKEQLLKKYEIDSAKEEELSRRLGFNEKSELFEGEETKHLNKLGFSKSVILASYKTKQDLISIVSGFSFEKTSNISIALDAENKGFKVTRGGSTGNSAIDRFIKGLNYVDATTKDNWEGLVKGVEDHINGGGKTSLNEEQAAYLDHIKDLGYAEHLAPHERYGWSGLTKEEKLFQAHIYLETKGQLNSTAGTHGEGLIKNAKFNESRRRLYSNTETRDGATSFDLNEDPLIMASILSLTSGKVSPELVGKTIRSIVNAARISSGNEMVTEEDAMKLLIQSGTLNDSPEDNRLKKAFIDLGQSQSGKEAYQYLIGVTRSMAFGVMSDTIKSFVNKSSLENYQGGGSEETIIKEFKSKGFSHEEATRIGKHLATQFAKGIIDPDAAVHEMAKAAISYGLNNQDRPSTSNKVGRILGGLGENSDYKAMMLLPVLGLIGQAIATGDITPEALQQTAGNAFSALGYMRMSTTQNGWGEKGVQGLANMTAGMGFKLRLAMQENEGDAGKALISTMTREATIMGVTHLATPYIHKGLEKLMGAPHLDINKFESGKSVVTNVLSQMAGTVLGMMMGNFTSKAAVQIFAPEKNLIETAITAAQNAKSSQSSLMETKEAEGDEDSVIGDNGVPVEYITQTSWASDLEYEKSSIADAQDIGEDEYAFNFNTKVKDFYTIFFYKNNKEDT